MDGWMVGMMDGGMLDGWIARWMDGRMDGFMYGWRDGRMNGWSDGQTNTVLTQELFPVLNPNLTWNRFKLRFVTYLHPKGVFAFWGHLLKCMDTQRGMTKSLCLTVLNPLKRFIYTERSKHIKTPFSY